MPKFTVKELEKRVRDRLKRKATAPTRAPLIERIKESARKRH